MGLEWIFREIGFGGGVVWIQLSENGDQWWAFVFAVMNILVLLS
jgi:hypothetical protein